MHVETIATALGTPVSSKWDAAWLREVDRVETELGHRICGAHTPAWTPCTLISTHPNGRCRFHGGHPGIGAPDGNRNAWVHGLYSRRLQQCGEHCPLWERCPMAGTDVLALPARERPHCAYEREEFEAVLAGVSLADDVDIVDGVDAADKALFAHEASLIGRNIALFQVMLSRAQAALGVERLTDETQAYALTNNYRMRATKVGALVQAQLSIARELRQWLKLLPGFRTPRRESKLPAPIAEKPKPTGLPMRMMRVLQETEGALEAALGLPPGEKCAFSPRLPRRNPPPAPA